MGGDEFVSLGLNDRFLVAAHAGICWLHDRVEHPLTTTNDGAVVSDAIWDRTGPFGAVEPILQLEDGSFAGRTAGYPVDGLLVFDETGNVKLSQSGVQPLMATAGGGLIAGNGSANYVFAADGTAVGQMATLPIQSWRGESHQLGSIEQKALPLLRWSCRGSTTPVPSVPIPA